MIVLRDKVQVKVTQLTPFFPGASASFFLIISSKTKETVLKKDKKLEVYSEMNNFIFWQMSKDNKIKNNAVLKY